MNLEHASDVTDILTLELASFPGPCIYAADGICQETWLAVSRISIVLLLCRGLFRVSWLAPLLDWTVLLVITAGNGYS